MGVPLAGDFDVAVTKPVDSRMVVTNYSDLNNILNKYQGLTCYVINDKNLYVFQGNNIWEKVVTNNVDYFEFNNAGNFNISTIHNGNVIYVNNATDIIGTITGNIIDYPLGYNVTIVQQGLGRITIAAQSPLGVINRGGFLQTAGQYAVISILRLKDTSLFLVYGDVI
jgi:hypothetical protein